MIQDEPDAMALLAEARRTLLEEIVPELTGDRRAKGMMVANALAIAIRELQDGRCVGLDLERVYVASTESPAALVASIRAGVHDASPRIHDTLSQASRIRVSISKPDLLETGSG